MSSPRLREGCSLRPKIESPIEPKFIEEEPSTMAATHNEALPNSVGFIGLGAMGLPMATNLANALPQGSKVYVHDTVGTPVDEFCTRFPDMAVKCASAKEVASNSVCCHQR